MFHLKSTKPGPETPAFSSPLADPPDKAATPQGHAEAPESASAIAHSEEAKRRAVSAVRQSLAFSQIVGQLMRSPHYKHYTLADIEWLVLPPLMVGQFSIAEARSDEGGPRFPAAVALWASVSPEIDKRLTEILTAPIRLRPDEWRSGDILWLVAAAGDARILSQLLKKLGETTFKDRTVKVRIRKQDGTIAIGGLSQKP